MTESTPQASINQAQIRVAAQVGVELLTSDTIVLSTSKMEAGLVLRAILGQIASGQAVVSAAAPAEAPEATPEAPPAPDEPKKPGRKKAPRKPDLKGVKS